MRNILLKADVATAFILPIITWWMSDSVICAMIVALSYVLGYIEGKLRPQTVKIEHIYKQKRRK